MAMKDLFDMTAGTSTGSILAAGLAYPDVNNPKNLNQNINTNLKEPYLKPGFFATDLIKIYSTRGGEIFVWRTLGWETPVLIIVLLTLFGLLGYYIGRKRYDDPQTIESFKDLRKALSNAKRENK